MKIGLETARVNELAIRRQYGRVDGCNDRLLFACPLRQLHLTLAPSLSSGLASLQLSAWPGQKPAGKGPPGRKKKDDVKVGLPMTAGACGFPTGPCPFAPLSLLTPSRLRGGAVTSDAALLHLGEGRPASLSAHGPPTGSFPGLEPPYLPGVAGPHPWRHPFVRWVVYTIITERVYPHRLPPLILPRPAGLIFST